MIVDLDFPANNLFDKKQALIEILIDLSDPLQTLGTGKE